MAGKKLNKQLNMDKKMLVLIMALTVTALMLVVVLAWLQSQSRGTGVEPVPEATTDPSLSYQPTLEELEMLDQAVKQAYIDEKGPTEVPLEVETPKQKDGWVYGSVGEERSQFSIIFLAELRDGHWIVALAGSDEFYGMAQNAPEEVVSQSLKDAFEKARLRDTSE